MRPDSHHSIPPFSTYSSTSSTYSSPSSNLFIPYAPSFRQVTGNFDELCRGPLRVCVFDDDTDEGGTYDRLGEVSGGYGIRTRCCCRSSAAAHDRLSPTPLSPTPLSLRAASTCASTRSASARASSSPSR